MTPALLLLAAAPSYPIPGRVVSDNPCVDAILAEVADPTQIAGISAYSVDPRATSVDLRWARARRVVGPTAEEVLIARPDLFISGVPASPATAIAVRRMGVRTLGIGVAQSIAESRAQVRTVAHAVGRVAAGERMVARIDAAVVAARSSQPPVPALIWGSGGLVPGEGSLADEMLRVAGFVSAGARYGIHGWGTLPLEVVLLHPPRVLLSPTAADGAPRALSLRGRIVARLARTTTTRDFPDTMLFCGGPTIVRVLTRLTAIRRKL